MKLVFIMCIVLSLTGCGVIDYTADRIDDVEGVSSMVTAVKESDLEKPDPAKPINAVTELIETVK